MSLAEYIRTGGVRGEPLEDQSLIDLSFALHKTVDELLDSDGYWVGRQLLTQQARGVARLSKTDYARWRYDILRSLNQI